MYQAIQDSAFQEIKTFLCLVETQSFVEAATTLNVSQSTVSRRISDLENRLGGIKLLDRTTRHLEPTEAGRRLAREMTETFSKWRDVENQALMTSSTPSGMTRMLLPPTLGHRVFMPCIGKLSSAHPNMRFEIEFSDHTISMYEKGLDFAVLLRDNAESGLKSTLLGKLPLSLVASPSYIDTHGSEIHEGNAADHYFVFPYLRLEKELTGNLLKRLNCKSSKVRMRTNSYAAMINMAKAGAGIAVVPDLLASEELAANDLKKIECPLEISDFEIYAYFKHYLAGSANITAIVAALTKALENPQLT